MSSSVQVGASTAVEFDDPPPGLDAVRAAFASPAVVQVLDKDLAAPPTSAPTGAKYIVATSPTGAWANRAKAIAVRVDGRWGFIAPAEDMRAWVADEDAVYRYSGSAWSTETAGTAFPASPHPGMAFTRTDLGCAFVWDAGRSAWLSVESIDYSFTNQSSISAGSYFRPVQGPFGSDTLGPVLPWTARLVEVVAWKNDATTAGNADVRADSASKYTMALAAGAKVGSAVGLDVAFASGAVVSVAAITTTWTGGGGVVARFRRSAT